MVLSVKLIAIRKVEDMKKTFLTKVVALAFTAVFAVSAFSVNCEAAYHTSAEGQKRQLTAEEIAALKTIFKADQYAAYYPDVVDVLGEDETSLFNHFISFGIWEERQPNVAFNVDVYASENYDLQKAFGGDLMSYYNHYINTKNEYRRVPAPADALRNGYTIYSVYDFVQGQIGPQKGAVPVLTPDYHPGITL
jgi:hypothetical protein